MYKKILLLLILIIATTHCYSQIVYVKYNATGLNNGTSWDNAYTDLSTAINNNNDVDIWVSAGVYKPTTDINGSIPTDPRDKTFKIKNGIIIYGGFNGTETEFNQRDFTTNITILSGDIGTSLITDNVKHVTSLEYQSLTQKTALDGLTIRDGYAFPGLPGGGIFIQQTSGSTFYLTNCIVSNNFSFNNGGGMYVYGCNPIIENCTFRNNKAFSGGAMWFYYSNAKISNNLIENNVVGNYPGYGSSSLRGGGIYFGGYSSPIIKDNIIQNNNAGNEGGGMYIDTNYEAVIKNNIVSNNSAYNGGGLFIGSSNAFLFNNVIHHNNASHYGGGLLFNTTMSQAQVINNTIVYNNAASQGGGAYIEYSNPNFINTLLYNNNSPTGSQILTWSQSSLYSPDFYFCNIQGGLSGIVQNGVSIIYQNNLDVAPQFINSNTYNYRLVATSPLIDAGTASSDIFPQTWNGSNGGIITFPTTDFDYNPRIYNIIDIGAFENIDNLGTVDIESNSLTIYPNPSNGVYNISSDYHYQLIAICDILGNKVENSIDSLNRIDLTNYAKGIYFIKMDIEGKIKTFKIIKN